MALRAAAVRLMTANGYDATSTDDVARAAGVSPRTFFNYFPTKESVVSLPDDLMPALIAQALRRRPAAEDVRESLSATAMETITLIAALGADTPSTPGGVSMLAVVRLIFTERPLRQIFLERRSIAEDVAWAVLQERGVAADDLGARAAVATAVTLTYLGIRLWADDDGAEPLPAVVARCLRCAPDPARFAAGATSPPRP